MKMLALFVILVGLGIFVMMSLPQSGDQKKPTDQALDLLATSSASPAGVNPSEPPTPTFALGGVATVAAKTKDTVIIKTDKGEFKIKTFAEIAPKTVANFLKKSQDGYYTNLTFHRVEDWVVQGGDPKGDGTGGGNMQTELNAQPFIAGSVGVARGGDIRVSNASQFFITKSAAGWLDKQYTNFGQVTEGMEIVEQIEKGDKILEIRIE